MKGFYRSGVVGGRDSMERFWLKGENEAFYRELSMLGRGVLSEYKRCLV